MSERSDRKGQQGHAAGHVVSKDGARIAFDRAGSGPPVVLVDGALCTRTFGPMEKVARELAGGFTVFTYDRRGRGESSGGADRPYAVEREIEDLAAVLEEAGGSASVFGASSGAVLALLASAHGLPIGKVAAYEPPLIVDRSRPAMEADWARIDALIADGRRDDAVRAFLSAVGVPGAIIRVMRWLPVWKNLRAVAHTLPYDGAIVREYQRGEPLGGTWARVSARALVLDGSKSPAWVRAGARSLAAVLPNAEQRTLAGQAHEVNAKVVAPVLAGFFA